MDINSKRTAHVRLTKKVRGIRQSCPQPPFRRPCRIASDSCRAGKLTHYPAPTSPCRLRPSSARPSAPPAESVLGFLLQHRGHPPGGGGHPESDCGRRGHCAIQPVGDWEFVEAGPAARAVTQRCIQRSGGANREKSVSAVTHSHPLSMASVACTASATSFPRTFAPSQS